MNLDEALAQIAEIRAQMSRAETFRGYRAATVAFSGLLAIGAGVVQQAWIPDPPSQIESYLTLWITAAAVSLMATGLEMGIRCYYNASPRNTRITLLAIEQFLPCVMAGALVTTVLVRFARESLWMLPGLWCLLFSLGVFASYRLLPRAVFWVAAFYLAAGGYWLSAGGAALAPWAMAGTFGVGQLGGAVLLYLKLERSHDAD